MRVAYEWLKEIVDFDLGYEEIIKELTLVGLECEPAPEPELDFENVVAAKIIKCEQAGDGFNLTVDTGNEIVPIYSTAPGLGAGKMFALALVGGKVNGKDIEPVDFGGNPSHGMACSEAELGLGLHSTSLMFLDESHIKVGDDLAAYLRSDPGIEIELTANRPDCWSLHGVAREIGAICNTLVKPIPVKEDLEIVPNKDSSIEIVIKAPELSKAYIGLLFTELKVAPSPLPVIRKLISVGLRPINNIVDITNLVLYELGQPAHAFDYDLIEGQYIEVRNAFGGEKMTTLDDVERELLPDDLVIADRSGAVALAGVMGGLSSEITFDTKRMFLENAHFDPPSIRRTSRRLGLRTDASVRFERGIDPDGIRRSAMRTAWYMENLKCGKVAEHIVEVSYFDHTPKVVLLRTDRMEKILGARIEDGDVERILSGLGFEISRADGNLNVTVPNFRLDVSIEEDLIEEVARHYRYDNLPSELPQSAMKLSSYAPTYIAMRKFKTLLAGLGLWEVGTFSTGKAGFIDIPDPLRPEMELLEFINPLVEDHAILRAHILPSLLGVYRQNLRHGVELRDIFEIARVFRPSGDNGNGDYDQPRQIGIASASKRIKGEKAREADEAGFLHVKGLVERFLESVGVTSPEFEFLNPVERYPVRVAINVSGTGWGLIGKISDDLLDGFDIPHAVHFATIDFTSARGAYEVSRKRVDYRHLEIFPSVARDIALVVPENVHYGDLEECIREKGGDFLREVELFDVFRSDKIGAGKKQFAVSLRFNHRERTLTDEEVDGFVKAIVAASDDAFGATLRDW